MSFLPSSHPVTLTASAPSLPSPRTVHSSVSSPLFPSRRSCRGRGVLFHAGILPSPLPPSELPSQYALKNLIRFPNPIPFLAVSAGLLSVRVFLGILPPDFSDRWRHLAEFSRGAEEKVTKLPYHLVQAVMASEDRRFFYHFGVDPYGIGRAVVFYPNGGGGSTITQQLVKNVFLTSDRKISRKIVEGILSLILERRFSKWEILYAYLSKMYWGHGKFGIEAASQFYFGKHPSLLNVGESALLAGILPCPEALNPITNPNKGKTSQARGLRRMVSAGFLDLQTAINIVSQPLCIASNIDVKAIEANCT